ncbi:MAG: hypothetical protein ACRC12_02800 [Holosporales bacterium]
MAIFFIAVIALGLFYLFLSSLARVSSVLLVAVLQWTSFSLLLVAFVLFILSGRLIFATLLLGTVFLMGLRYRRSKNEKHKPLGLVFFPQDSKPSSSENSKEE